LPISAGRYRGGLALQPGQARPTSRWIRDQHGIELVAHLWWQPRHPPKRLGLGHVAGACDHALVLIAGQEQPPRRFVAGADAIGLAEQKVAALKAEIRATRACRPRWRSRISTRLEAPGKGRESLRSSHARRGRCIDHVPDARLIELSGRTRLSARRHAERSSAKPPTETL